MSECRYSIAKYPCWHCRYKPGDFDKQATRRRGRRRAHPPPMQRGEAPRNYVERTGLSVVRHRALPFAAERNQVKHGRSSRRSDQRDAWATVAAGFDALLIPRCRRKIRSSSAIVCGSSHDPCGPGTIFSDCAPSRWELQYATTPSVQSGQWSFPRSPMIEW